MSAKWITIVGVVFVLALALWVWVGFYPLRTHPSLSDAGSYGESFGLVNSLFSSFGFAFVALALLLQIKELRDTAQTQAEQGRMQLEQMQIAERTARIQEAMRLDEKRRLAMDAFLRINQDTVAFKHAFVAWHPENNPPTGNELVDQGNDRRLKKDFFNAYTALRANCLSVGLLFDRRGDTLGKAIQDLYDMASRLIGPRCPPAAECEEMMNQQIKKIEEQIRPLWESLSAEDSLTAAKPGA